jgi:tRNA A-37 threonylcarbamoyl transferase component Bud32
MLGEEGEMSFNTRIGTEIAGYRLERQLGQGAFAAVYLAEHVHLGKKVAVKVLDPTLARDEGMAHRFIAESRIAADLDHPGIIPILNAGEQDGLLFIVMKYVQGRDLATLIREEKRLSVARTSSIIDQVAGGLDAAHAKGLVHRDIKPENILIEDNTEHAYVIDFGIVKRNMLPGASALAPSYSGIGFKGTPYYASPEQIESLDCDARSDVYALGGVVYACLTGMPPYGHLSEYAAMNAHVTDSPPSVTAARPELPYTLDTVVNTAMAKRPDDRYASCGEFARALRAAAHGHRGATHEPSRDVQAGDASIPETVLAVPQSPTGVPAAALAMSAGGTGGGATPPGGGGGGGGWDSGTGGGYGGGDPGKRKSGGLSDAPRWLIAVAAVGLVAILALALGGAYELGKGDDTSATGNGGSISTPVDCTDTMQDGCNTTTPEPTSDVPPDADADQKALWLMVPKTIRKDSCHLSPTEHAGGIATLNCNYMDPAHGQTLIHVDRFIDNAHLQQIYAVHGPGEVKAHGGSPNPPKAVGRCGASDWLGEGPWRHEMGSATSPVSGRVACYQADGQCDLVKKMNLTDVDGPTCSVIVFTNDAAHLFIKAEAQSAVHNNYGIFGWYKYWHHQFG